MLIYEYVTCFYSDSVKTHTYYVGTLLKINHHLRICKTMKIFYFKILKSLRGSSSFLLFADCTNWRLLHVPPFFSRTAPDHFNKNNKSSGFRKHHCKETLTVVHKMCIFFSITW